MLIVRNYSDFFYPMLLIATELQNMIVSSMAEYRLRFLDPSGKFIRSDRIHCFSDAGAVVAARERHLSVRSELWRGPRLVAKFRPSRSPENPKPDIGGLCPLLTPAVLRLRD